MSLFSSVDTVILRVRRLEEATSWYVKHLGLEARFVDPASRLAVLATGGATSLTLWELAPGETPAPAGSASAFPILATRDADAAHAALAASGVDVEDVREGGGVRYFGFRDPDGNRIEACQLLG